MHILSLPVSALSAVFDFLFVNVRIYVLEAVEYVNELIRVEVAFLDIGGHLGPFARDPLLPVRFTMVVASGDKDIVITL